MERGYESKNSGCILTLLSLQAKIGFFSRTDLHNEMFNEPEKEMVFERVEEWLGNQLAQAESHA